jgi:hypothetical protein
MRFHATYLLLIPSHTVPFSNQELTFILAFDRLVNIPISDSSAPPLPRTHAHTHTHTHTHTHPRSEPNKTKKNCFLTFHMSGWCQTLLLDSQKSLLFLCKREVLSRRECFRTLIYLEMTQLFSTLSSLSLAQDRNSGNQNTWRNDCMFSSVQWLSRVWLFGTPWPAGRWASVSITNSRGLLKLMSIESVMPSNHLSLCRPLLLCLQSRLS